MDAPEPESPLDLYAQGRLPLTLAAMRAVLDTPDSPALAAMVERARRRWGEARLRPLLERLDGAAEARVRRVAAALDHTFQADRPEAVVARLAQGFDAAAAVSADAGVALYSLGDPQLLAEVTAGVVDWLRSTALVRPSDRVVEVGCGSGRFLRALAAEAGALVGVEISPAMAREAARRLQAHAHVAVVQGSGLDLGFLSDASVDLVLFADSFPYLVQAGGGLPERLIGESARVLRPAGRIVVLNWSYRDDLSRDAADAAALAAANGLTLQPDLRPVFEGWDARALVLA